MCPGREEVKNRITTAEVGGNTTFVNQWSLANAWFKIIVNWIHYLPNDSIANNHCYLKIIISPGVQHKWQHELELQLHPTRHQSGSRPKVINFFFSFSFDIFCEVVLFVLIFLSARLVFSDLLYHFAFPLRLASTSFPQVLESTRVQLSGYLRALWRRSLPRHWQVHRGEKEVHGSEIQ